MLLWPLSSIFWSKSLSASMATLDWNSISGKQGSGPGFSLVRPTIPELLSSHHAADYCSSWQHLISSCQLQHGNLISSSQLEPGELLWGNVNSSVNLPGFLSSHASSSRQVSLSLLSKQRWPVQCCDKKGWRYSKVSKEQASRKDPTLPENCNILAWFWQLRNTRNLQNSFIIHLAPAGCVFSLKT